MKKYRLTLMSGQVYEGTPKEIVMKLRDGSMFHRNEPLWLFMKKMGNRHLKYGGKYLNSLSYGTFVHSLSKSEICRKFEQID